MSNDGSPRATAPIHWAGIWGPWDFSSDDVTFKGVITQFKDADGRDTSGPAAGLAMSNRRFSGGELSADVTFRAGIPTPSCELVFYYDAQRRAYLSAGISEGPGMYIIRQYTGKEFHNYAVAGNRANFKVDQTYSMRVRVIGSQVTLTVDGVEVLQAIIPASVPPSQAGVWCYGDSDVEITNFAVTGTRGRVFVVMQFTGPFNDVFNEVLKNVCDKFDLKAFRADEVYGPGLIIQDVERDITESEFVIADITPVNANVYYEVGYARAANKEVILLADRGQMEKLPFDVAPFRVLFYENTIGGKRRFEEALEKHIAAVLRKRALPERA
jgi:hypothetical protein